MTPRPFAPGGAFVLNDCPNKRVSHISPAIFNRSVNRQYFMFEMIAENKKRTSDLRSGKRFHSRSHPVSGFEPCD
ncbi:hypothetical protein [Paraburkholderia sp. J41]|uniref:hypothetical protein n=1 Tax=Paraburkholderia sp. J41 TaxID=2805433 RepID=UPI002AC368A5|nr:hypothetical protein [Paraburkholderia sp. J41]